MSGARRKSTVDPKSIGPSLCVTQLVQLTQLGIPLEHVTWPRVTITPNQWLCIRHTMTCRNASTSADRCSVVTVFNPQRSKPQTYKVEARCAKLNPDKPLLAITDQWTLYLYSTRTKKLLHKSRLERELVYWAWVTPSTLGLVTRDAVFHWDCSAASTQPVFMFALEERIRNTELVGYITDPGLKWLAVTGLFQEVRPSAFCSGRYCGHRGRESCFLFVSFLFGLTGNSCMIEAILQCLDERRLMSEGLVEIMGRIWELCFTLVHSKDWAVCTLLLFCLPLFLQKIFSIACFLPNACFVPRCVLMYLEQGVVSGLVQLHGVERRLSQLLPGQCAQLCRHQFPSHERPSQLLLLPTGARRAAAQGRLHLIELGAGAGAAEATGAGALRGPIAETLEFFDPLDKFDFPVCLQVRGTWLH
ncbi:hypothetical protein HPB48_026780 [Haemaphysalis longicornis]|uniref:Uncharacterized protein n=1 Tax=Haemaphysalis longicornis TaxID=44386 RepID=A0A9J6H200_HAELO|nr:hypothetical protein HPB48_026780 [Haemaphysalis longicornis]